ncbi:hypothetical protein Pint_11057 [Pistacia integerrima]|uniref:Uncharacterized protein n=1 Tax=Pistacia integerrima TaxID=434235 RepID=A0ACC0XLT1_9ROSI|nr:hypothetical protein Pint_11057 [Pistacia integerrima]
MTFKGWISQTRMISSGKDAVITLQGVIGGKCVKDIDESLHRYRVSREAWWSAFYRIVEGLAVMGRLGQYSLQEFDDDFEESPLDWDNIGS